MLMLRQAAPATGFDIMMTGQCRWSGAQERHPKG